MLIFKSCLTKDSSYLSELTCIFTSEMSACFEQLGRHAMHAQVITEGMGAAYLRLKLKDQASALGMLGEDAALAGLRQLRAPLLDLEVRGLPALQYFGGMVWRDAIGDYSAGEARTGMLSSSVL